ncbi:hypothetical protein Fcan01_28072 [Folsomia candida]|uniref:BD-FAE-like domain-containing protein n=1 Tax=Folsomia candida TaxID=158441 RepID=A0A226CUP6_FOLCA|nr:hypothetical protein Fcan01_28072 [Folsomia candida]
MDKFTAIMLVVAVSAVICERSVRILPNVPYGPDAEQILDLYLPKNESTRVEKVIVLLHGAAWGAGDKEDFASVPILREVLPNFVVANMNYRLGSAASPGYPKQLEDISGYSRFCPACGIQKSTAGCYFMFTCTIFANPGTAGPPVRPVDTSTPPLMDVYPLEDIQLAIAFLKSSFTANLSFTLFGNSAGAQLAMLYAYWWDREARDIKIIVDHVGLVDFVDPPYCNNIIYRPILLPLVGPYNCQQNPEKWNETSPIIYATENSPPTIGFYGDTDIFVPNSQMGIIQDKLARLGVPSEFSKYPGGHGDWVDEYQQDMWSKLVPFVERDGPDIDYTSKPDFSLDIYVQGHKECLVHVKEIGNTYDPKFPEVFFYRPKSMKEVLIINIYEEKSPVDRRSFLSKNKKLSVLELWFINDQKLEHGDQGLRAYNGTSSLFIRLQGQETVSELKMAVFVKE